MAREREGEKDKDMRFRERRRQKERQLKEIKIHFLYYQGKITSIVGIGQGDINRNISPSKNCMGKKVSQVPCI